MDANGTLASLTPMTVKPRLGVSTVSFFLIEADYFLFPVVRRNYCWGDAACSGGGRGEGRMVGGRRGKGGLSEGPLMRSVWRVTLTKRVMMNQS